MGQATWITLAGLPVYLVNSIPKAAQPALGLRDFIGLAIWLGGFGLEVIADRRE
jgi:steroid 5-alpha reductase family enzyme